MKKYLVMAIMLAMMVALASPAFAQAIGGDVTIEFFDASQTQAAAATQAQHGDATATADGVSNAASAAISQSLEISQSQWNGGF